MGKRGHRYERNMGKGGYGGTIVTWNLIGSTYAISFSSSFLFGTDWDGVSTVRAQM